MRCLDNILTTQVIISACFHNFGQVYSWSSWLMDNLELPLQVNVKHMMVLVEVAVHKYPVIQGLRHELSLRMLLFYFISRVLFMLYHVI